MQFCVFNRLLFFADDLQIRIGDKDTDFINVEIYEHFKDGPSLTGYSFQGAAHVSVPQIKPAAPEVFVRTNPVLYPLLLCCCLLHSR